MSKNARKTPEQKLAEQRAKLAKLEKQVAAKRAREQKRAKAGPAPTVLNRLGRDARLIAKTRDRLRTVGSTVGTATERTKALEWMDAVTTKLRADWQRGYQQQADYAEDTGDTEELDRIEPLDGSAD